MLPQVADMPHLPSLRAWSDSYDAMMQKSPCLPCHNDTVIQRQVSLALGQAPSGYTLCPCHS